MLLLNLQQDLTKNENIHYEKMLNNTSCLLFRQRAATKPNLKKIQLWPCRHFRNTGGSDVHLVRHLVYASSFDTSRIAIIAMSIQFSWGTRRIGLQNHIRISCSISCDRYYLKVFLARAELPRVISIVNLMKCRTRSLQRLNIA